jgi:hypothetical protein
VVLVLALAPAEAPKRFAEVDWGMAWQDALERHAAWPDRVEPGRLGESLDGRRLIVVSHGAQSQVSDSAIAALRRWAQDGGSLILELPDERWSACAPALPPGMPAAVAGGTIMGPGLGSDLPAVTPFAALEFETPGDTLLWIEGSPVAARFPVGRGEIRVLGFDLGRWLVSVQQGIPRENFTVPADAPTGGLPRLTQPDDLVAADGPVRRMVPGSDRLQRLLLDDAAQAASLARWRLLPDSSRGLYLPSHDEEGAGDNWLYFADHEREWGWPATWFVMSDGRLRPAGYRRLTSPPLEVGSHPDLLFEERANRWRVMVRRVVGRARPGLREQTERVRARVAEAGTQSDLRLSRVHYLSWSVRWADRLLGLADVGIRLDSSYGPDEGSFGYLFGTGLPFRPLDERGRAIPIWEAPFQAMDDREFAPAEVLGLFENAQGSGVGLIFHTNTMARVPRADILDTYLSAPEWARKAGFRMMSYGELLDFWEARRARFDQRWSGDTLAVAWAAAPGGSGLTLQLSLEGGGRRMTRWRVAGGPWRGVPPVTPPRRRRGPPPASPAGARREGAWLSLPADSCRGAVEAIYGARATGLGPAGRATRGARRR